MAYIGSKILARLLSKPSRTGHYTPVATFFTSNHLLNSRGLDTTGNKVTKETDILLHDIKSVRTEDSLFRIVSAHGQVMNQQHVIQSIHSLFDICKRDGAQTSRIVNHPSFEKLCAGLRKYCRAMDTYEVIEALKVLIFLGVDGRSSSIQYLLQMMRDQINELNIQQIVFLHFVLTKCENNHLADALKLALPLAFQLKIGLQLDHENVIKSVEYFRYAVRNNIPEKYVNSIVSCLILQLDKLDCAMAVAILMPMCELSISWSDHHVQYKKLVQHCLSLVADNVTQVPYVDLIRLLNFTKDKVVQRHECFYQEKFFSACSAYPILNDNDLQKSIQISNILTRLGIANFELYDYIADLAMKNPEILLRNPEPFVIFSYVNTLATANYKPRNWETLKNLIVNDAIKKHRNSKIPWLRFVAQLVILDIYDDELINKVFAENYLEEVMHKAHELDYIQILNLYHAVKVFHPEYDGSVPSFAILEKAVEFAGAKNTTNPVMRECLNAAFGGEKYVATNIQLMGGMFADFVIHFDDHGVPIEMPENYSDNAYFDDLQIKNKENSICIMKFNKGSYLNNMQRLRGVHDLHLRMLEKLEYNIIPISNSDWNEMPGNEKIPFIIREINLKLPMPVSVLNQFS